MPAHNHDPRVNRDGRTRWWTQRDERLPVDPDLAPDDPGEPSLLHHPGPHIHRARQGFVVGAVFVGGLFGALGRYELELIWPAAPGHIPWATLLINTSGAFLLGLVLTLLLEQAPAAWRWRALLCTGVIGAWTTMSTFAIEVDQLLRRGDVATGIAYVLVTVVLGLAVGWFGIALAHRCDRRTVG
jgi:fluoride exporter